ncbi:hypothetical protein LBMAG49_16130 [Planctomycetota bacterium]|nr:hypothetical protein LBMAG49_16130 [Planctomycetota bacterium]
MKLKNIIAAGLIACVIAFVLIRTSMPPISTLAATNRYGIKQENQTEVFVAADVSQAVAEGVKETLAAAVKCWGSSGRLEFWVLGADRDAAMKLAADFCARRIKRGDLAEKECLDDIDNKDHGFLMYQAVGAKALSSGQPQMDAANNGGSEWGIHRLSSSLPLGFSSALDIAGEGDQITILHEYWHSVQRSFLSTQDQARSQELMGPAWFVEGSAVAMAEITATKLLASGGLPKWNNSSRSWPSLTERMANKMKHVQIMRDKCASLLPESYGGECNQLAYDSGGWAILYLLNKFGEDVLRKSFHPEVESLGWEICFKKTFKQSSAEFVAEFAKFMDLPLSEQIKIVPAN